ncbi:MAG TPA: hypothetical protein VGM23_10460, partial [Armatimonadota bacterium]
FVLSLTPPARAADKPVDVLMIGHTIPRDFEPWWPKFQAACAKENVRIFILNEDPERGLGYPRYTSELLKRFQVVVFSGLLEKTSNTKSSEEEVAAFRERLDAYSRAGGGVIWVPLGFGHWGTYWNKFVGDRYDVRSLEEDLYDPPKTVDINPALRNPVYRYIWTTNVAKHPVTEGVRGLLLPVLGEWSWPGTVPMKFGKSWTPLVRGMDSTVTIGNAASVGSGMHQFKPEVKGSYTTAPDIVGVRDRVDGYGRMMVFPFHSTHTWLNFNHFAFNDAMMLKGDGTHPSDGLRLFLNGCKWLAEPAAAAGLGGYQQPKQNERPALTPVDWSTAAFVGSSWSGMGSWWDDMKQRDVPMDLEVPNARDFKGIVGARTAASDGQGSVADYVVEAKKLGLSFIIFLENLEQCDDARYAQLVADCKTQTNETFSAIPGYLYRDLGGNLHFAYDTAKLPLPANLTPERRVIAPNDIVEQNSWSNGQGLAELGKLKLDMAYLFLFTAVAPYVYDEGKLVDDGLARFCYSEGLGHQYAPVSLTIVRSPRTLAATVASAHLTVVHAEKLADLKEYLGRDAQHPHPVYLTNGPTITRWGALNPLGHSYWPGKDRVRFALSADSAAGIREVQLLETTSGTVYRDFHPNGAKTFTCTIDESHKQQWNLVPMVTDMNGRTAIAAGMQTYQDGNRQWPMGDRLMGMDHSMGWDDQHQKLMKMGGWLAGITWIKPYNIQGGYPTNPRDKELKIQGIDGGAIHPAAIDLALEVSTNLGVEPKVAAFRFHNTLASFDYAVMDYLGDAQFLVSKRAKQKKEGWWETPDPQVPNEIADIHERVWAVRPRYLAAVAANVHEVTVTFKRDAKLDRIRLAGMRSGGEAVNLLLMARDTEGEFSWLIAPTDSFNRKGTMPIGGYLFPANYRGGAPGIINLGPTPIDYTSSGMSSQLFVAGNGRQVKAGEQITVRFITFMRPWQDQTNNRWLKKYISDFGIGTNPGYAYTVSQGKVREMDYALDLDAAKGGAAVEVKKYDLPHNLVVRVFGLPGNAIAGRYDLASKQLLILPVLEGMAPTSINTTLGVTKLYIGELFHCSDPAVRLSAVQDGADTLQVEIHNPTDKAKTVTLTSVRGFAPLANLKETVQIAPYSSEKRTLRCAPGTVVYTPYSGG